MSLYDETFTTLEEAERTFYAPGVFLDAEDMKAEQLYHRGRLARVLTYLHGTGTAAGLRVSYSATQDELQVAAGIAIDRVGRLIEVPRAACMSVTRWLDHYRAMLAAPDEQEGEDLFTQALTADRSEVVADVFVRFAVCARGRTPAFAVGPFDSIDASAPHRLRDSYEILLALRGGDGAPLPSSPWPARASGETFESWNARLRDAVLDAWRHGSESWQDGELRPDPSTVGVSDPTAVFLARVRVPIAFPADGTVPERRMSGSDPAPVLVDNDARSIVPCTAALARALETP